VSPAQASAPIASAIEMRGITRRFGSLVANDSVDFELKPGEIHALLGENGAGKTTLLRMLSGYLQPDSGSISIDGAPVDIPDPATALGLGIGMVHQHSVLVPELTVAENIVLGRQPSWTARYSRKEIAQAVAEVCEEYGVELDPNAKLGTLSADRVQQVEIVRLLHRRVGTVILDEPTAILGRAYVDQLFETLAELRERGHSVAIITHKMREVMAIADRVTVMRGGKVTASLSREEFDEERLTHALVGSPLPAVKRAFTTSFGPTVLDVRQLEVAGDRAEKSVDKLDLSIRAGEILGIAGVEGNGQRELVEALSGVRPIEGGSVEIEGRTRTRLTPSVLDRAGVAVISEDRLRWDVIGDLTLAENLMLTRVSEGDPTVTRMGFLRRKEMTRLAQDQLNAYDVRPGDPTMRAGNLSGGNQQKLVLARETDRSPRVVIAAHPSRGLDIAATGFVHKKLLALRDAGAAILLVSADLDELLAVSDRVAVIYRGRIAYECDADGADTVLIGRAMIGALE
jgi:simple sugar transport system ATP-binding protein